MKFCTTLFLRLVTIVYFDDFKGKIDPSYAPPRKAVGILWSDVEDIVEPTTEEIMLVSIASDNWLLTLML